MKKVKYLALAVVGMCICLVSVACGTKKNGQATYKGLTVYSAKVKSVRTNSITGAITVKGSTSAPDNAKVLIQPSLAQYKDMNTAGNAKENYAKVKNHKFSATILNGLFLTNKKHISRNQKIKMTVFAVSGYKEKYNKYNINADLREAIKKSEIKPITFKVDEGFVNFYGDALDRADGKKDSQSSLINATVDAMNESFHGDAKFGYDAKKKTFTFVPTNDTGKEVVKEITSGEDSSSWSDLTKVIDQISKGTYEDMDLKIPLSLIDPSDNRILYTSLDGKATYDFLNKK